MIEFASNGRVTHAGSAASLSMARIPRMISGPTSRNRMSGSTARAPTVITNMENITASGGANMSNRQAQAPMGVYQHYRFGKWDNIATMAWGTL